MNLMSKIAAVGLIAGAALLPRVSQAQIPNSVYMPSIPGTKHSTFISPGIVYDKDGNGQTSVNGPGFNFVIPNDKPAQQSIPQQGYNPQDNSISIKGFIRVGTNFNWDTWMLAGMRKDNTFSSREPIHFTFVVDDGEKGHTFYPSITVNNGPEKDYPDVINREDRHVCVLDSKPGHFSPGAKVRLRLRYNQDRESKSVQETVFIKE